MTTTWPFSRAELASTLAAGRLVTAAGVKAGVVNDCEGVAQALPAELVAKAAK